MKVLLGFVKVLMIVLLSTSLPAGANDSVVLTRNYREGSVVFRRVETKMLTLGEDSDRETEREAERILVKTVERDGTVKFAKVIAEDAGGNLRGISFSGRSILAKVDKLGRVLSMQMSISDAGDTLLPAAPEYILAAQLSDVLLPGRPVRVGEMWETRLDNMQVKGEKFLVRTTLLGSEEEGGKKLWRIKQTAALIESAKPSPDMYICRARFWLDATTNMLVRSDIKIENSSGIMTIHSETVDGEEQ